MPVSERAKQFAPFDALRGLDEALERKRLEMAHVSKRQLEDTALEELNNALSCIEKGDFVKASYYEDGDYLDIGGVVSFNDTVGQTIRIDGTDLRYDDIYRIEKVEKETD
jgi:hypothetical protein